MFHFLKENGRKSVTDQCPNLNTKTGQPNRSSRKTSCSEGMFTPVLACGRLSRRDNTKALAALHARMLLHLLNQAAFDPVLHQNGYCLCFGLRQAPQELCSRPATPNLCSQHDKPRSASSPANTGYVASFVLRACSNATPGRRAAPRLVVPSLWRGDTIVVSMANWAPWNKVNPSAMTSILRPSSPLNSANSKSRMKTFVVTLAPASLHTCAAARSRGQPLPPKTPASEDAAR